MHVKSISLTCDNEYLVVAAMRKILFRKISDILQTKIKIKEKKMQVFGNATINQDV